MVCKETNKYSVKGRIEVINEFDVKVGESKQKNMNEKLENFKIGEMGSKLNLYERVRITQRKSLKSILFLQHAEPATNLP